MKMKFTIGEVARIAHVSAHTLRYYDKIGLLKPKEIDEGNRYRYYTYEDFLFLDTIKYLKTIGMSLEDIKLHFAKRSIDETLQLYMKQLDETERRIKELEGIREHIQRTMGYLEKGKLLTNYNKPQLTAFPERYAVMAEGIQEGNEALGNPFDYERQYNMLICNLADRFYQGNLRIMGNEMAVKSYEDLMNGEYTRTIAAGNMLTAEADSYTHSLPEGDYACIYHKGSSKSISNSYKILMSFIRDSGFEPAGNSYELFLVDSVDTGNLDELITSIQIPVKNR